MSTNVKRLFSGFQPNHYEIDVTPSRESKTLTGSVTITGTKRGRPSRRLTFHQKGLTIESVAVTHHDKSGDKIVVIDRINHHRNFDEVRLHSKQQLYPGPYTIKLTFSGKITHQMEGVYPCLFTHDGKKKELIATQFESHHAREVFPCIDEPEAKATFQLSLTSPRNEVALSNTPVASKKPVATKNDHYPMARTVFEKTPKMSTYLLAFIFGELGYLEATTKDGVLVRTYATPDNVEHTRFALEVSVRTLEFFNEYFAVDYPLKKCDLIALPDFGAGAMENWGCITFREQALLVDAANSSLSTKQYVAMVVAHELAHQWFGNLVTMRWWTDLWLNEGFASWIEYLAVDELFPDWDMWTQFIIDEQQIALKLDALENTHPIEVPIRHPDEIRSIFDTISYNKGASAIHMLYKYLGPRDFRTGLQYYLRSHAYGSTDTVDLWKALEEASEKPVQDFMHAWTSKPGFPLVKAVVDADGLHVTQERFYASATHETSDNTTWPIALQARTKGVDDILAAPSQHFHISTKDSKDLKINQEQSGFFRVSYNSSHIQQLGELVKTGKLGPLDRLGVVSDMAEAAKAGYAPTSDALHFFSNFKGETNFAVWDAMSTIIGSIRTVMDDEQLREAMKPFVGGLVTDELKRLGWEKRADDSHFDLLLRTIILGLASYAEEPSVVKHAKALFAAIPTPQDGPNVIDIDPDLRGIVYGTIVRLGGQAEFDKLFRLYKNSNSSEERVTLTSALASFKQPEIIDQALALVDSEHVRLQDVAYWLVYSFANRFAKQRTWAWTTEHWDWLESNLGGDMSFGRMPLYAARSYSDRAFLKTYKAFFEPRLSPVLDRSYKQGLEIIEWQSAWKDRDLRSVKQFFTAHQ